MTQTAHPTADKPTASLPQLTSELFAFALSLRSAKDPGNAQQLFDNISQLLEQLSQRARNAGVDSAHLDATRYAFCALLDETVLSSRWQIKTEWMSKPLQMSFYGDFTAGEQFYQRLENLRSDATHNVDVIEVYAHCLAAGFRGKHSDLAGMQKVNDLLAELGAEISTVRGIRNNALSKTFTRTTVIEKSMQQTPVWMFAAVSAGVVLCVLFLLNMLLSWQAGDFINYGVETK